MSLEGRLLMKLIPTLKQADNAQLLLAVAIPFTCLPFITFLSVASSFVLKVLGLEGVPGAEGGVKS
jgi:hypothetical protein